MGYLGWSQNLLGAGAVADVWTDPTCTITTDVTMPGNSVTGDVTQTANTLSTNITMPANSIDEDIGIGCGNQG